jgi:hypothetical protein
MCIPPAQNALEPGPRHRPNRMIPLEQTREVRALRQVMWVGLRLGEAGGFLLRQARS